MKPQPVRAAFAAFVGTSIEWYDFYIYGTAASLVFGDVFFSTESHIVAALASLATFAVGFIARPFGAIVFGHIGDKVGRKKSLIITLLMMGGGSTLIGLLPSYDSIGAIAVVFLVALRFVQGVAVGGEWGGAVLIAAEHAPPKWRTILASVPQYGSSVGLIMSTLAFRFVSDLPREDFYSWGWRIPFVLSGVLLVIAYLIRTGINESPEMLEQLKKDKNHDRVPLREVFQTRRFSFFCGIGACVLGIAGTYFVTTLMISYTTMYLNVDKSAILDIIFWIGFVEFIAIPAATFLATRFGERRILLLLSVSSALWAAPMMMLVATGDIASITIAILVGSFLVGACYGVIPAYLLHAFPVHMRYTGISLSYQLCGAIFGGATPLVGIWLAHTYNAGWLPLAFLFAFLSLATFVCVWLLSNAENPACHEAVGIVPDRSAESALAG